jgi:hypothetical protein
MPLLEDLYAKQRARQIELAPFHYSANFLGSIVTAGVTLPVNTGIQSDSHFVVRYVNMTATTAGEVVAVATPPFLVSFFDTGSGRTLFDAPQPVQNVCGGVAAAAGMGNLPFIFPEPWLVRAGGTIQTTLVNSGVTTFVSVRFSLIGFKVFKFGGGGPAEI